MNLQITGSNPKVGLPLSKNQILLSVLGASSLVFASCSSQPDALADQIAAATGANPEAAKAHFMRDRGFSGSKIIDVSQTFEVRNTCARDELVLTDVKTNGRLIQSGHVYEHGVGPEVRALVSQVGFGTTQGAFRRAEKRVISQVVNGGGATASSTGGIANSNSSSQAAANAAAAAAANAEFVYNGKNGGMSGPGHSNRRN